MYCILILIYILSYLIFRYFIVLISIFLIKYYLTVKLHVYIYVCSPRFNLIDIFLMYFEK